MFFSAAFAIFLREMLLLRRRAFRLLAAAGVSPLLYLLTFGLGLGRQIRIDGGNYLEFLLPGLVAMSSMTQAFSIASEINIARFYTGVFEEIQAAPVGRLAYVLGEVASGVVRALVGAGVIIILGLLFGVTLRLGFYFWLGVLENAFAFAALAVALAMLVKSHSDQSLLSNFVITPMAFLGGTFFPLDRLPDPLRLLFQCLPLTHATQAIRAAAGGNPPAALPYLILALLGAVFLGLAVYAVGKAKD